MGVTREGRLQDELMWRYMNALPGALTAAAFVSLTRVQRIFVLFRPRGSASGDYLRSLTVSAPYYDGVYLRVKIGPTVNYGQFVEFGRPPGKAPPIEAMVAWVREKHISGSWAQTGRGKYKRAGTRKSWGREDRQAAFLIGRAIAERGTKPFPALRVGFRQSKQAALQAFTATLARGMAGM